MKYYWAKWCNRVLADNPFVVGIDKHGLVYRISGADVYPTYMDKTGLLFGPEIPGPPAEWEE